MKKITHLEIFSISENGVFDSVNSYGEMNIAIINYGKSSIGNYNNRVGDAFEIFTQFFCNRFGSSPLLSIESVKDTSDDSFNAGFDFTYTDINGEPGQIQSKWRKDPKHQFHLSDLSSNGEMARNEGIGKDNNVLFMNFNDHEELFHYTFKGARKFRRVVGRHSQEDYILRDDNFWDDFRKCIKESAVNEFVDPFTPRDVQEWIMDGIEIEGEIYEGTVSVLNGKYSKGRVEANTGAGKTLCQFYDIDKSFKDYNKSLCVMVLPTLSLIDQTFNEFYTWKMFGHENKNGEIVDSKVSCLIIRSGSKPRYNDQIANVLQTLSVREAVEFIQTETNRGQKIVMFTTMKSQDLKYSDIVDKLSLTGIKINLEIIDEYHNIISSSSSREKQEGIANYLENNSDRCDGTIFYSASNKHGQILDSFNEDLFGKLLAKVTRNDLSERAYVSPKLIFKCVKVPTFRLNVEEKTDANRIKLDKKKAYSEGAGIIKAFNDLKNYYDEPNLIIFGSHVEGCRFLSHDEEYHKFLPNVKNHFIAAETSTNDRVEIIDKIKESGNNILHQHSVAKEGVNIPNLHGCVIGRDLNIISSQQGIGRSDRALYSDTIKFNNGELVLDDPNGWEKYYNLIYVLIDDDNESFYTRMKMIIRFLLLNGIPEDQWDIQLVDDEEKTGVESPIDGSKPTIESDITIDYDKFEKLLSRVKIEVEEEIVYNENKKLSDIQEGIDQQENDRRRNMTQLERLKEDFG